MRFYGLYLHYFALSSPVNFGTCRAIFPLGFEVVKGQTLNNDLSQGLLPIFHLPKREYSKHPSTVAWRKYCEENRAHVRKKCKEWRDANKEKLATFKKAWYLRNKDRLRAKARRDYQLNTARYGKSARSSQLKSRCWTLEEVQQALIIQNGRCAICTKLFGKKTPHADHCHASKKKRELLCHFCNTQLGIFENNRELFEVGFPAYLRRWTE